MERGAEHIFALDCALSFRHEQINASLTLKVVVAAEILACVSKSIGGKIQTANSTFEIEYLLAWTLVAIVFGFVLEGVVAIFKRCGRCQDERYLRQKSHVFI